MFDQLPQLPADPILGLTAQCRADNNPQKVDLGVGVYKNEDGQTPVLSAVKEAERRYFQAELSKAYLPPAGTEAFVARVNELTFGANHPALLDKRVATLQGTGGCGSLRVAAELIKRSNPQAKIWISDPSWPNHSALLGNSGLAFEHYPYYDQSNNSLNFDGMIDALKTANTGDVVLLHASCHNPSGADLSQEQWQALTELAGSRGFIPLIDMAYQGFGTDVDTDAYGIRLMAHALPEVLVANSFSKNFGLYRERVGCVSVVSNSGLVDTINAQLMNIARTIYSMPPAHGAALVEQVLSDESLKSQWLAELATMRDRIKQMRTELVDALIDAGCPGDFEFIRHQNGMFSFLGLSKSQVEALKRDYSVYMVDSSRISICGLNSHNLAYVARAITETLKRP